MSIPSRDEGRINDDGAVRRPVQVSDGIESGKWGLAMQGGMGIRIPLPGTWSVSLAYAYRYWHPVRYGFKTDLPLRSIPYWESFRTHIVELLLGFPY